MHQRNADHWIYTILVISLKFEYSFRAFRIFGKNFSFQRFWSLQVFQFHNSLLIMWSSYSTRMYLKIIYLCEGISVLEEREHLRVLGNFLELSRMSNNEWMDFPAESAENIVELTTEESFHCKLFQVLSKSFLRQYFINFMKTSSLNI